MNFYSTLVNLESLTWPFLATGIPWASMFQESAASLLFRQTGLDMLNSDPKQPGCALPLFHSPSSICDWGVFVSLSLSQSISGRLFAWHLSGLAYFLLDLISQCEDPWRPSPHLALWISASSVPVSAVGDWLTHTHTHGLHSSLQGPLGKGSTSPQTDSLICMAINHQQKLTLSHTTRHDTES